FCSTINGNSPTLKSPTHTQDVHLVRHAKQSDKHFMTAISTRNNMIDAYEMNGKGLLKSISCESVRGKNGEILKITCSDAASF
ncbi:hypothetical protein PFISCL1PPCAC_20901, partial [Pristionchus fissidentatus]